VPAKSAEIVTESGKPALHAPGARFLRLEQGRAVFEVGSGSYSFQSSE
jgi:alpha-L-rhamnosidase